MKDKYKRDIDYLRVSLTDHCNLRCIYCMPSNIKFEDDNVNDVLSFDDYKFIVENFAKLGITKIRFTGGEPLLYPYLEELISFTSKECNIKNIAITTNGIGLYDKIDKLKECGLKKVNISLDSLKPDKYSKITRSGKLEDVMKSMDKCVELGIIVKLNCVLINTLNDDEICDFVELTKKYPIDVRFIELMPIGEGEKVFKKGYINLNKMLEKISGLKVAIDEEKSVAEYYKFENAKGRVGIITPMSCSFCSECNKIRLTSSGTIKLCLHSREEIDIKPYLNDDIMFADFINSAILEKPKEHNLLETNKSETNRKMYQIGG